MREKSLVQTMVPWSILIILQKPKISYCNFLTLQFIYHLLPDLILAINEYKGIDNPLARVGCKYLLLCV